MDIDKIFEHYIEKPHVYHVLKYIESYPSRVEMIFRFEGEKRSTILCYVCYNFKEEVVKYVLDKGANPNGEGCPLFEAIKSGYLNNVKLMVEKGADVNAVFEGKPMLTHVSDNRILPLGYMDSRIYMAKYLIENGSDYLMKDSSGNTYFDFLCEEDLEEMKKFVERICTSEFKPAKKYSS